MAAEIPIQPPRELRIGDTAKWTRSLADFKPGDGWTLSYTVVGATFADTITATPDGDGFSVTIPAATSQAWAAGNCVLVEFVSDGTDRYTLGETHLVLRADIASIGAGGADLRSPARRMLDAIEGWMQTGNPALGSVTYGDRRIDQYDVAALLNIRSRLRREVEAESGGRGAVRQMLVTL